MFLLRIKLGVVVILMAVFCQGAFALTNPNAPTSTSQAVYRIANRLVLDQVKTGEYAGTWPDTAGYFTGTMAAGLVDAYAMTCEPAYKTAAELSGTYIRTNAPGCALYYDEAYLFMLLSQMSCTPSNNAWRTTLQDFYRCLEAQGPDPSYDDKYGTELYVARIEAGLSPAYAVFEVAYYTVAAYYIDTPEKTIWREELLRLLETSNVDSGQQIYALGAAIWALAQTGPLDSTPTYVGAAGWAPHFPGGVATQMSDLPKLLATYQLPAAYPIYGNQFYSVYLPPNAGFSGWTETNIYAVLGLDAADEGSSLYNYRTMIDSTWAINMQPVDYYGYVWYNALSAPGTGDNEMHYIYAGEYLQYLAAARLPGDIDLNDAVDSTDLMAIAGNWLSSSACPCNVVDLNRDRKIDMQDLARLSQGWLLSR